MLPSTPVIIIGCNGAGPFMVAGWQLRRMRAGSRHGTATVGARLRVVGWLALLALCLGLVVVVAGSATAAVQESDTDNNSTLANDTTAPEWVSATKAWPTEIHLRFNDTHNISRDSITASDFALSTGEVSNVSVEPANGRNYTDVTVELILAERLDVDAITVSIAPGGAVADAAGNKLTSGSKRVTGMDTLVPDFERFELTRVNESTVEVLLATNEPLTDVELAVTGPTEDRLNMTDFTAVDGTNTTFTTRYRAPEHGAYSFVWERAVDRHGNFRVLSRMRQFRYADPAPEVALTGPNTTTVDTPVNFSAAETADEDGIDSYRWRIDGGTVLSGPSIQVAFAVAGSHDVTLAVTDSEGNTGVETRAVTVERATEGASAVSLTRRNDTQATATVDGTGLVQQVRPASGSLVTGENVTFDRLEAVFPANRAVSLDLRGRDDAPDSFSRPSFGRLEIDHDGPANRVSVRFSVDRASLNAAGVAPEAVTLYRNAEGWQPLTTSIVSRTDSRVVYRATAPALSQFAVGAAPVRDEGAVATETDGAATGGVTGETGASAEGDPTAGTESTATQSSADASATPSEPTPTVIPRPSAGETATNQSAGSGSLLPGPVAGLVAGLPNPLALWPSGLVGTILGALVGLVVVVYSILKALAIYLGY